ncbi:C4-dicarboxylate ABC transporter permease [Thalassobacillus devorans]|uniref:C4-dicarboxylate ABC transporter permease n=1 Tax=Thalassobacillus devorans TaxID=279813 RepID=A0ABQ1P1S0_9BACI|nr:TRAP transporter large permease [Thalassobacillus devorans]NIK28028.1 tripartite ATP-independent transporter DctM subunit [Thalassobacillus devorans]GGC89473.1 C4-dicarboxylate ABC transporter permease [Thalassobacillus devorans]
MDNVTIIIIILAMVILLLLTGLYIHSVLFATGIIGLILLEGFSFLPGLLGNEPFDRVASYTLTTIPLFVLMAQFILQSGIVKDLFYIVHKVAKGKNSVLGILTISIGGLLGAVSGSGTATSASLGQVAIPELRKHRYSSRLAGAIAAAGGSLSGIIPPSIILILYGVATETPVGQLFIGALIPGVLVMIVFIAIMLIYYRMEQKETYEEADKDSLIQQSDKVTFIRLFVVSLAASIIVLIIFVGIYAGIFTPTEAGAVGAFVGFLAALCLGKVNFEFLKVSLVETLKLTGMVMLIMIGAQIFGRFVSLSMLPRQLIAMLDPIMGMPALVLIVISLVLFVMFMFIEGAAVILMSIPVLLPIITELQIDLLWFGVFVGVICTIGLITPPVGLSVYAVAGVSGIKSDAIFRVGMAFAIAALVIVCGTMIAFPEIATFLPDSMSQ